MSQDACCPRVRLTWLDVPRRRNPWHRQAAVGTGSSVSRLQQEGPQLPGTGGWIAVGGGVVRGGLKMGLGPDFLRLLELGNHLKEGLAQEAEQLFLSPCCHQLSVWLCSLSDHILSHTVCSSLKWNWIRQWFVLMLLSQQYLSSNGIFPQIVR